MDTVDKDKKACFLMLTPTYGDGRCFEYVGNNMWEIYHGYLTISEVDGKYYHYHNKGEPTFVADKKDVIILEDNLLWEIAGYSKEYYEKHKDDEFFAQAYEGYCYATDKDDYIEEKKHEQSMCAFVFRTAYEEGKFKRRFLTNEPKV